MHGILTERTRMLVTDLDFAKFASQGRLYTAYVAYEVPDIRMALKACCCRFRSIIS